MSIEYVIFSEHRLVHVRILGYVKMADYVEHFRKLSFDPAYERPMRKLMDYRGCTHYKISAQGERGIARERLRFADVFAGEQCAIFAPEPHVFGMKRIYQAVSEQSGMETAVFSDLQEAMEWLGFGDGDEAFLGELV